MQMIPEEGTPEEADRARRKIGMGPEGDSMGEDEWENQTEEDRYFPLRAGTGSMEMDVDSDRYRYNGAGNGGDADTDWSGMYT